MASEKDLRGDDRSPYRLSAERRRAYEAATYRVAAEPAPFFLRVGDRCGELDRRLEALGASRFAFLTAANPRSQPLSAAENEARHRRLIARVRDSGRVMLPGDSFEAGTGAWREASLLVVDIDCRSAVALARDFEQSALLVGALGEPVRLVETCVDSSD